jgi:hypothetical protein
LNKQLLIIRRRKKTKQKGMNKRTSAVERHPIRSNVLLHSFLADERRSKS